MVKKQQLSCQLSKDGYQRFAIGIVLCAFTALMLILAFHPYNVWPLAFFALVPMLIAQYRLLPLKWCGLSQAIGVGGWLAVFLPGMFGGSPAGQVILIVVAVIVLIQLVSVPGTRRFHERTVFRWFILQGVADWVGLEMVRSFIPLINTHAFIAQTMHTQPWMLQPVSIFSIYGLAMLIILVNYSLAQAGMVLLDARWSEVGIAKVNARSAQRGLMLAGLLLVGWVLLGQIILANAPEPQTQLRVAAIQHNFRLPGHQDTPASQPLRLNALADYTRQAAQQSAKVIVWPELGLGFDPQVEYTEELQALARQTSAYLFVGYGLDDPRGWRNEVVVLNPTGEFLAVYGKNHPTSPGEPPVISAGAYPVHDTPLGRFAAIICNDVHYTNSSRILTQQGAQLIAVPTFETAGIVQEQIAQSVLRAVENRVALVKADGAYSSVVIDPFGRIVSFRDGSPQGAAFALVADVPILKSGTLYTYSGDWLGWLCLAGFIFFIIFQCSINRKQQT